LAGRFATFREAAVATTRPPGVGAVKRAVARRDAVRTILAAAVVALLAGLYLLVAGPEQKPQPITPTPSTSPSTVDILPRTSVGPSRSASASPTASAGSGSTGRNPPVPVCTFAPGGPGPDVVLENGTLYVDYPTYLWTDCPGAKVRVYAIDYEWDPTRQRYIRSHFTVIYLTAAHPTAPRPAEILDPIASVCGPAWLVAVSEVDPPTVLPTDVGEDPDGYWQDHHLGTVLSSDWNTAPAARQSPQCQPGSSSS
jgi:hypothetical protein